MSSWSEERRRNLAAEAEQRRKDKDAAAERRRKEREAEDKRHRDERRADKDEKRNDRLQRRRDRRDRRRERVARREKALAPETVYRRGTLALVAASALASLPAQIMHFVRVSMMLLPLPFALEGSAWVMAAGVAYADEKRLPAWVRWLLRGLSLSAAGFAANINYQYGAETNSSVGWSLAAVTLGGPLFFEVRQWVTTLSAAADPKRREERRKARHEKARRKDHKDIVKLAKRLVSAAPYNTLSFENAFKRAWVIKYGTDELGMTPEYHQQGVASAAALAAAKQPKALDNKAIGERLRVRLSASDFVLPTPFGKVTQGTGSSQVVTDLPPSPKDASETPRKGARRQPPTHRRSKGDTLPFHPLAKSAAAVTAHKVTAANGHHH